MGSWQETCGLTSTPIYSGEKCVMIVLDEVKLKSFQGFFPNGILGTSGAEHNWKMVIGIFQGTYSDYGWLNEVDDMKVDDHLPPCLFFHESAWKAALKTPEGKESRKRHRANRKIES